MRKAKTQPRRTRKPIPKVGPLAAAMLDLAVRADRLADEVWDAGAAAGMHMERNSDRHLQDATQAIEDAAAEVWTLVMAVSRIEKDAEGRAAA